MKERRFVKGAEVRTEASGHIDGHAAVFGAKYVLADYPDFKVIETIKPGAFSRAIREKQNVVCVFNHNADAVLGRTPKTLSLSEDWKGLYFDCEPPDTQVGRDVRTLIERGDVAGASFAFSVVKQTRTEKMVGQQLVVTRQIEDVDLYDVSPVLQPAYESTDVSARQVDFRSLFSDGAPEVVRAHLSDLGLPREITLRRDTTVVSAEEIQRLRLRVAVLQRL